MTAARMKKKLQTPVPPSVYLATHRLKARGVFLNVRMLVAFCLFVALIGTAILAGGPLWSFFDVHSMLIVVGGVLCGTLWSFEMDDIAVAFRDAFVGKSEKVEQALQSHTVFSNMANYSAASGLIGTLIGLVSMLQRLDDPTAIGPSMAVALLTLFYGVFLGEFCFRSMANNCLSAHHITLERQDRGGFSSLHLTGAGLLLLLVTFFVMMTAMCG